MHTDFYINGIIQLKLYLNVIFYFLCYPFLFSFSYFFCLSPNSVPTCTSWCISFNTLLHSCINFMQRCTCTHTNGQIYFILYLNPTLYFRLRLQQWPTLFSFLDSSSLDLISKVFSVVLALAHCSYFSTEAT